MWSLLHPAWACVVWGAVASPLLGGMCARLQLDSKDDLSAINEVAEMKRCNTCVFFEARKNKDLFLWVSKTPNGPSAKCHVSNGP